MTLVREGYENSDSVVDEKPGCKATGYLFVERQRRRGKGREGEKGRGGEEEREREESTRPSLELDSNKGEK